MSLKLLIILSLLFPNSYCSIIDVKSIHVIPDLYRLCWKQFVDRKLDYLKGYDDEQFPVFEDLDDSGKIHCIEKRRSYRQKIFIPVGNFNIYFQFYFNRPLICSDVIMRKRVVSDGVYFQSDYEPHYINWFGDKDCTCFLMYGSDEDKTIKTFYCRDPKSKDLINEYRSMKPGTSFNLYYSCEHQYSTYIVSKFVTDQGIIFPQEKIYPLQPFLQLPFRRYLVGQWKNPHYVPEIYKIVIYKINNSTDENCLKIFHLYRSFTLKNLHTDLMSNCNKSIPVEDLGIFHSNGNDPIHFVLDMVEPLRLNTRYKLSILWMNPINELEENFIYFEPLPNENSGNINSEILNFNQENYTEIRNMISDMRQNVINQYPPNITESQVIDFTNSSDLFILQSVHTNQFSIGTETAESGYYHKKCEEIPHCADGPHPFFYLMTKTKSNLYHSKYENYMVELITIPKREIVQKTSVNMSSNSKTATFKLSWNINSDPKTNIPSLFAVLIMKAGNDECASMFIVMCQTCNKMHQKISEYNSRETLKKWSQNCKILVRLEDHYSAMSSSVTIETMEMVPAENFITQIHAIHLNTSRLFGRSKPNYIKESFSSRHRTMIMTFIFGIIGLVLLISLAVLRKRLAKDPRKQSIEVDSNEYYVENEF